VTRSHRLRILAWTLGIGGAIACAAGAGVVVAFGVPAWQLLLVYLVGALLGLLGALIASRQPGNSIGWLMYATSLVASLLHVPVGYGYLALIVHNGAWPLGPTAVWLGAWGWVPVFGIFAMITLRFPDGNPQPRWRFVDWLVAAGTALFVLGIALGPREVFMSFLPIPQVAVDRLIPHVQNPFGAPVPRVPLAQIQGVGLALLLVGGGASAASLVARFRNASGDERLQLKWFAYAGTLFAAALVYGGVAWSFLGQPLYLAMTPLMVVALTLPAAIGIAILRYRLYDIDLIINRSLVYGGLTAILYAVYVAVTTFLQRLLISVSGQKSDAAYVLAAFVVVGTFNPIKDWLQRVVNRRLGGATSSSALDQFSARVEAVVSVMDVRTVACQLVDQAVVAYEARGAALYLTREGAPDPFYSRGRLDGDSAVEVALRHEGRQLGRLALSGRRGGVIYTKRDVASLQRSADAVGKAVALATQLGQQPTRRSGGDK
jgi:hypothetical protein